jgi:CheY-like chemotaxis protein
VVKADPGQIEQVILNLAVNARDAMTHGGRLRIETAVVRLNDTEARYVDLEPGSYAALYVSDTGCGMDAETRSHAFEPFFTTKEEGKGTGLGLSTVYGIVKQNGGSIMLDSEPGSGTTFKIYLPHVAGQPEARESRGQAECSQRGAETVLVVEDEALVLQLSREVLEMQGYRVLEARHGPEAIEIAERHQGEIDLMVTDVVMPRMNGVELYDRLKAMRPNITVLFMSGHAKSALGRQGTLPPGTAYLQKPFKPRELARKVRAVLTGADVGG